MLHGYVSTVAQNGHTAQERTNFQSVILITIHCHLQGMYRLRGYIRNTIYQPINQYLDMTMTHNMPWYQHSFKCIVGKGGVRAAPITYITYTDLITKKTQS